MLNGISWVTGQHVERIHSFQPNHFEEAANLGEFFI
jgi:hypothetical protein